jgi:mono/diheme cytochrome c family protein
MGIFACYRPVTLCLLSLGIVGFSGAALAAETDGQNLFEKRCAACHKLPDLGQPPSVGWELQLEAMAPLARLKDGQKQDVLAYLLSHTRNAAMDASLDEDRILFEVKCSRCHTLDRVLLSPLEGDALGHVINRMQSRSGTDWLSDQDVERVLTYLSEAPRMVEVTPIADDANPGQVFATRCAACHSLERVFRALDESENPTQFWSHTVSRMQGKAPQWMSETEADQILDYLTSPDPEP